MNSKAHAKRYWWQDESLVPSFDGDGVDVTVRSGEPGHSASSSEHPSCVMPSSPSSVVALSPQRAQVVSFFAGLKRELEQAARRRP